MEPNYEKIVSFSHHIYGQVSAIIYMDNILHVIRFNAQVSISIIVDIIIKNKKFLVEISSIVNGKLMA